MESVRCYHSQAKEEQGRNGLANETAETFVWIVGQEKLGKKEDVRTEIIAIRVGLTTPAFGMQGCIKP